MLAFYSANAAISTRYGDGLRYVLRWYVPCLVLTPGMLLPAALLLPAWAAVGCAAALVFLLAKLSRWRTRGRVVAG
ncbi:hypothetical protein GCM10010394_16890 [Streptomyces crystallinus]|uniref:Uncharacterized protein n=1 Tax=Streptomyces crystallinus TaxID=68191 RepID=A0ABN1FD33_9ACTN